MVVGEHSVIRTADSDDAPALMRLYESGMPLAGLLNPLREFLIPTTDEVRGSFSSDRQIQAGVMNAIEDLDGVVRGFCALRVTPQDAFMGQLVLMLPDEEDYAALWSGEVGAYLLEEAFQRKRFSKVVAQCLDHEEGLRAFLSCHGFKSDGVQREVLYSAGRWFDMESLSLMCPAELDGKAVVS